jgi:hypothetical protein
VTLAVTARDVLVVPMVSQPDWLLAGWLTKLVGLVVVEIGWLVVKGTLDLATRRPLPVLANQKNQLANQKKPANQPIAKNQPANQMAKGSTSQPAAHAGISDLNGTTLSAGSRMRSIWAASASKACFFSA